MSVVLRLVAFALILLAGLFVTRRVLPWLIVRLGRLLGFRMRPTPLTAKRIERFRRIRRGYVCFLIVTTGFVLSLFLELYVNDKPLYIRYGDHRLCPAVADWLSWVPFLHLERDARAVADQFGLEGKGEVPYRDYARWVADPSTLEEKARGFEEEAKTEEATVRAELAKAAKERGDTYDTTSPLSKEATASLDALHTQAAFYRALRQDFAAGKASIWMPLYPYAPTEQLLDLPGSPPQRAFGDDPRIPILGTDFEGKDVLSQILYGFRVSFAFAIVVAVLGFSIGIAVGAVMGYFGKWIDIVTQRVIEVWEAIPFLYVIMIFASVVTPSFLLLALLLVLLQGWTGITYTMRGEYYRERSLDYVQAARALGVRTPKILARHIFPNALVPVVTFMPFQVVGYISTLVALDYLGFGLPVGTPSWGRLLNQGAENVANYPELVLFPILALAATLFCVVMVGEAVREAFDPKLYSRLR